MYLIFDTETTGLPYSSDKNSVPARILQLAAIQLDENFKLISSFKSMIRPEGWVNIHPKAFEAHNISYEMCMKHGCSMQSVLNMLRDWASNSKIIIAHNLKFDQKMTEIECSHFNQRPIIVQGRQSLFCTMMWSTEVCKIPHPTRSGYKWPKVKEAYKHFFGVEPDNQHDALGDVLATAEIFKKLHALGIVKTALAF